MEQFIAAALDAYLSSNGDIDKFELLLRRMVMGQQNQLPTAIQPMIDSDFQISPEMAEELAVMDLDNMTDDEILQYATRMGIVR